MRSAIATAFRVFHSDVNANDEMCVWPFRPCSISSSSIFSLFVLMHSFAAAFFSKWYLIRFWMLRIYHHSFDTRGNGVGGDGVMISVCGRSKWTDEPILSVNYKRSHRHRSEHANRHSLLQWAQYIYEPISNQQSPRRRVVNEYCGLCVWVVSMGNPSSYFIFRCCLVLFGDYVFISFHFFFLCFPFCRIWDFASSESLIHFGHYFLSFVCMWVFALGWGFRHFYFDYFPLHCVVP